MDQIKFAPKQIFTSNEIPFKISAGFYVELTKFLNLYSDAKIQISQNNFEKIKSRGLTLLDFKAYYEVTVVNTH